MDRLVSAADPRDPQEAPDHVDQHQQLVPAGCKRSINIHAYIFGNMCANLSGRSKRPFWVGGVSHMQLGVAAKVSTFQTDCRCVEWLTLRSLVYVKIGVLPVPFAQKGVPSAERWPPLPYSRRGLTRVVFGVTEGASAAPACF